MAGKSASLLTKTQRQRIGDDFGDLEEAKKRRDQQRIRDRLRSGVLDFRVLADYPDSQFEMAFEDLDDDERRAALRDASLVVERLREVHGYDRDSLVADVRERANRLDDGSADLRSLDALELETPAEVRAETEATVRERYGPNRWDRRASRAMKVAGASFVVTISLSALDEYAGTTLVFDASGGGQPLLAWLLVLLAAGLVVWTLVSGAQALKYQVVPLAVKLLRDPGAVAADAWSVVRKPGRTARRVWDDL